VFIITRSADSWQIARSTRPRRPGHDGGWHERRRRPVVPGRLRRRLIAAGGFSKAGNTTVRAWRWVGAEQTWKKIARVRHHAHTSRPWRAHRRRGLRSAGDVRPRVSHADGEAWHPLGSGIGGAVVGIIDNLTCTTIS
jgi:hypothetical protein